MGHPGQFVVLRDGAWTPYRVSTLYLPTGLLAGPAAAVRNVAALGGETQAWLYCEGGAVIDLDRHHLLWYGALPLHPEWLTAAGHVLARTWPGWQVRWAFDGVHELADHVGLTGWDLAAAHAYQDPFGGDQPQPPEHPDDPIDCLVTVRHPDGGVTAHPVGHPDLHSLLTRGPALVEALPAALDRRRLPVPVSLTALHVDVPARHVTVWGYERPHTADSWWLGWQVDFRADRYTEQNTACGLPVSRPLTLDWAYAALRCHLTGEDGSAVTAIAPNITNCYGTFFQADGDWRYTPQERAAALTAIDAAQAEPSTRSVHGSHT